MPDVTFVTIRPAPAKLSAADRRDSIRHPCDWVAFCKPCVVKGEPNWEAQAHDVSQSGIRLVASRRFEPGTLLFIDVRGRGDEAARRLTASVVYVRGGKSGQWTLGCKFVSPLDYDDVEQLVSEELPSQG
jgi:hypothetical protein